MVLGLENNHETAIAWHFHEFGSSWGEVKEWSVFASFLTLQQSPVDVLVLWFGKCWILVEEVGHKRKVKFGVSRHHIGRCDKLSAAKSVSLLQHSICSSQVIFLLKQQNTMIK